MSENQSPPTIAIVGQSIRELAAASVVLHVQVTGSSFFSPNEAMKRAEEVRALIDRLGAMDIGEDQIELDDIHVESSKGVFTRTSKAKYDLTVRVKDLERLPDILIAATDGKHAAVLGMDWRYDAEQDKDRWIKEAMLDARSRGDMVAQTLGSRIAGVHRASYQITEAGQEIQVMAMDPGSKFGAYAQDQYVKRKASLSDTLGTGILHKRKAGAVAKVEFLVESIA